MKTIQGLAGVGLIALLAASAFAQQQRPPADEFAQEPRATQPAAPACPPVQAPAAQSERKRMTAIQAIKGGAELGALIGELTGTKKGVRIGTVAGGVAGLIWEQTAARRSSNAPADAPPPQ
jgi:hypothetical protein